MTRKSNKRNVIDKIFNRLREIHPDSRIIAFDNDEIKGISGEAFKNQFDATKYDSSILLPQSLRNAGFFILHLGRGSHAFVKGEGYHKFESITQIKEWKTNESIMDELSKSEAQTASTAFNDKIIHDFLFNDTKKDIKLHTARRAKVQYSLIIGNNKIEMNNLQIEMDGVYECESEKTIAVVEVKNTEHPDFEIRQLFSDMKYFEVHKGIEIPNNYRIRYLFMIRIKDGKNDMFKIYEYDFKNKEDPNSIYLKKSVQYNIIHGSH